MKKHLHKTSNFPSYALLFLLGVSAVYFASAYTDINTALINATQYIQKIVLTNDGNQSGVTGIVLDWVNGKISASQFCDLSWTCKTIDTFWATGAMWATGATWATGSMGPIWMTWDIWPAWATGSIWDSLWQQNVNDIFYNSWRVGIGINTPTEALQISGNIKSPGFYSKGTGVVNVGGNNATAMGYETTANWNYSTAMGYKTLARRDGSTAMWWYTEANWYQSTAMGYQTYADWDISTTIGYKLHSKGKASLAIGGCNEGITGAVFEIWIGLFFDNYNCTQNVNAVTILQNGKVWIGTSSPSALLTVNGWIKPIGTGSNPCGTADYPEGTMFYNSSLTGHYYCFCDNTITAKKMSDETTNCF